jgi:teichoic acid transport system permease protein
MSADRGLSALATEGQEGSEPNPLGAAATLPGQTRRRATRSQRRVLRRQQHAPAVEGPSGDDGSPDVVHVFVPHAAGVPPLRWYMRSLWRRRRFLAALAKAELRGKRSSTALGSIWGLLDPIFQSAIYFFLFVVIRGGEGRPIEFLPLLIGGIFLFRLTMSALSDGGGSVRKSSNLLLNSSFPRAILPLATVYKALLGFLPSIVVFAGVYAWLGAPPSAELLLLPLLFALVLVVNVGMALLASTVVVFFKDAQNAIQYVSRVFFFTTPIIYPVTLLPDAIRSVLMYQPLFALFAAIQQALAGGPVEIDLIFLALGWAVILLVLGAWMFLRYERAMASRL